VRRAYYEAATRDVLVQRAKLGLEAEPGLAGSAAVEAVEAAANAIVDAMLLAGRVDLDEVAFLNAQRFFTNDAGEVDFAARFRCGACVGDRRRRCARYRERGRCDPGELFREFLAWVAGGDGFW